MLLIWMLIYFFPKSIMTYKIRQLLTIVKRISHINMLYTYYNKFVENWHKRARLGTQTHNLHISIHTFICHIFPMLNFRRRLFHLIWTLMHQNNLWSLCWIWTSKLNTYQCRLLVFFCFKSFSSVIDRLVITVEGQSYYRWQGAKCPKELTSVCQSQFTFIYEIFTGAKIV